MDIKELLKNGASAEELKKVFAEEYKEAKAAIDAEQKAAEAEAAKEKVIEEARLYLAEALIEYECALGYQDTYTVKDIEDVAEALKKFESQYSMLQENMKRLEKLFS